MLGKQTQQGATKLAQLVFVQSIHVGFIGTGHFVQKEQKTKTKCVLAPPMVDTGTASSTGSPSVMEPESIKRGPARDFSASRTEKSALPVKISSLIDRPSAPTDQPEKTW